ncbi:MAG: hypothetical protein COB02_09730 [Candidatus Cloacimonadota bacterium]|nr:MAG: hypothetical protein COB02_09730 [Candidatus Cloacimonadota bacterium]
MLKPDEVFGFLKDSLSKYENFIAQPNSQYSDFILKEKGKQVVDICENLYVCIKKGRVSLNDASIPKCVLFHIQIQANFSKKTILKICDFVIFLAKNIPNNRLEINKNVEDEKICNGFTADYLKDLLLKKGVVFFKKDYSRNYIKNLIVTIGSNRISLKKRDIQMPELEFRILPFYDEERVNILCNFVVDSINSCIKDLDEEPV